MYNGPRPDDSKKISINMSGDDIVPLPVTSSGLQVLITFNANASRLVSDYFSTFSSIIEDYNKKSSGKKLNQMDILKDLKLDANPLQIYTKYIQNYPSLFSKLMKEFRKQSIFLGFSFSYSVSLTCCIHFPIIDVLI